MSHLILCEPKKFISSKWEHSTDGNEVKLPIKAWFRGPDIIVDDLDGATVLLQKGYGTFIGQRMDFTNKNCFQMEESLILSPDIPTVSSDPIQKFDVCPIEDEINAIGGINLHKNVTEEDWNCLLKPVKEVFLSLEEAVYLMNSNTIEIDGVNVEELWRKLKENGRTAVERSFVYRHFRDLNWIVKPGIVFGGDYSIYQKHPDECHSSAVVRIGLNEDSLEAICLRRELKNLKKALLIATVTLSSGSSEDNTDDKNDKIDITDISHDDTSKVTVTVKQSTAWLGVLDL